ncbi:MAG: hypothetical protein BRD46_00395, partial [Bacteroidetes bacterium QS_8_68_15]
MIGAAFFFSLMSACVETLGDALPSQQIVLVRSVVTLGYSWTLVRWAGKALWGTNRRLLLLRGLFGLGGLSCFFWALTALPLADATVLHYTNPVLTALLAAVVLGERLGPEEIGGALMSFAGVGRMVPEIEDEAIREVIYRGYRIVYVVDRDKEEVEVLTIFHSAQQFGTLGSGD